MAVFRADFATTDPEAAEDLIRQMYLDQRLRISSAEGFEFAHRAVGVAGPGSFTINRLSHSVTMRFDAAPMDDVLITNAPRRGTIGMHDASDFDSVVAGPGQVLLGPPTGGFGAQVDRAELVVSVMSFSEVAEHAFARWGIDPESVRFTGLAPISPPAGNLWISTVGHVRDDVLADPELSASPVVLASAFQLLASALLATFPNTVLDALTDPLAPAPRGQVGDASAREVVDYLHSHADQPVRPSDVVRIAGASLREVDETLRRRRHTTVALELWRARMQGAYRDLHQGDPAAGDTVAAIAARWGFTNPMTFAVAYQLSADESPGHTLRRR